MILTQFSDNLEVLETIKSLRPDTRASNEVKLAVQIFNAFQNKDIEKYFRLFRKAPYLIACCCVYSISEMRKRALRIFAQSIVQPKLDPKTGRPMLRFKIELETLTDLLCFNDCQEASKFLPTLGYKAFKTETGTFEVMKEGEPSELWKPRTNYKYIESKKIVGSKIHSRADIIRGVSCRSDVLSTYTPSVARVTMPIPKPTMPKKLEVKKVVVEEEDDSLAEKRHEENIRRQQEDARKQAREVLEKKLKDEMEQQKEKMREEKKKEMERKAKAAEAERVLKELEAQKEKARKAAEAKLKKEKEIQEKKKAEERRRRALELKINDMINKNTKKRHLEILKYHFARLKTFHKFKQQLKNFVESC